MPALREENMSGVRFDWVFVRELMFKDQIAENAPQAMPEVTADIRIEHGIASDQRACTVKLSVDLSAPNSSAGPFVRAVVEGHFSLASEKATVNMPEFAAQQGPVIMLPFLRDAVATVTGKSRFGQILLAPINIQSLTKAPAAAASSSESPTK